MGDLYIGLMSGTSLDGVDAVLVDFAGERLQVLGHRSAPFSGALKSELLALNTSGADELHRAALAGNAVSRIYASLVQQLLSDLQLNASRISSLGAHGQTVRHRPQEFDGTGYTLQLQHPALLAELTGIRVVADFRSRDVAAGGQGAPYDAQGRWAAQGTVHPALLEIFLKEPFLQKAPPKSTGRDLFNVAWLNSKLQHFAELRPADVQATLTELTAQACANTVKQYGGGATLMAVCGGGALNKHLMHRLKDLLAPLPVEPTDVLDLPVMQVEACAFAWLARQTILGQAGNLPNVTGAQGARVLGAIYPA